MTSGPATGRAGRTSSKPETSDSRKTRSAGFGGGAGPAASRRATASSDRMNVTGPVSASFRATAAAAPSGSMPQSTAESSSTSVFAGSLEGRSRVQP